jgi:hypothetical protein
MGSKKTEKKLPKKQPAKKSKSKVAQEKADLPIIKEDVDLFDGGMNLGELLWEYRAKMAEWEKVYLEGKGVNQRLAMEKLNPKYKELFSLIVEDEQKRLEVKRCAGLLRSVQEKAAAKLGISLEEFLTKCTIDHETGVVRFLD